MNSEKRSTQFKQKQVFDQPLGGKSAEQAHSLDPKTSETIDTGLLQQSQSFAPAAFEKSEEIDAESTDFEKSVEKVIRPTFGGKRALVVISIFSALVGWQAVDSVVTALQNADWLSLSWAGFVTLLASLGVKGIFKELWQLRKLKNHFDVQTQSEAYLQSGSVGGAVPFCDALAKRNESVELSSGYDRWKSAVSSSHNDEEVIELYDALVVAEQDKQAVKIVSKVSGEAALLVAVSPLAIVDMLLVAWRSFSMCEQLANVYGIELGYWSRLKLFKFTLLNMAAAGASEIVAEAGMDLLSMDLAGKISTRAAQGIGVGVLSARLGIKAMTLLRPTPWKQERKIKLSDLRKDILSQVKSLTHSKESR